MRTFLREPRGRVVVVGGGRQGVAAGRLLAKLRAPFIIADDGDSAELRVRLVAAGLDGVPVCDLETADLAHADLIVLSAGVPRMHPAVQGAIAASKPVVSEIDLAAAHIEGAVFVGITGTNGKSTTTTIAGSIARTVDPVAFVGGNLGTPLCEVVVEGGRPRYVVIELSSYQLETISVPEFRSVVVTNLSPDHLDRYSSVDAYYATKARIFSLLSTSGGSSINQRDPLSLRNLSSVPRGEHFDFDVARGQNGIEIDGRVARVVRGESTSEVALTSTHLVGRHNLQNAAAAICAMHLAGCSIDVCRLGLEAYRGISHRLERIAECGGVVFINDSKATNVDAALKAVASFDAGVHLIAGGRGKGASYEPLVEAARGRVVRVYAIGEDAPLLKAAFEKTCPVTMSGNLATAFTDAVAASKAGDTVLLAPACASFDQWKNYEERGHAFATLARGLAARLSGGTQ
jgi:UDP-N-acetylmuramoylalanine--D-glutamate ligase